MILPRKTVLELGKLLADSDEPVDASTSSPTRCASASATSSSSRKVVDGKFPDYNRVIPTGHSKQIELDRARAAGRAAARRDPVQREVPRRARGARRRTSCKIICTNSEQEEAEEELEVDYDGDALDIGFNITYLLDVLPTSSVEQRAASPSATPTRARSITMPERDDFKYVVMPMRI